MTQTDSPGLGEERLPARREVEQERNELLPRLMHERPTRLVCIGGGTGLPVVLKGLARRALPKAGDPGLDITAIVAMSDDGGSSGKLRRSRGLLPPGDIRNCLVALSGKNVLTDLFQYRFDGTRGLGGHAVGNLLIAALAELKGDFLEAVRLSGRILDARGTVLPSTLAPVQLVARMEDDSIVVGERNIARAGRRVSSVALEPCAPPPAEGTLEAIHNADLIVIGPGSLYSSVLPNLLVDGVARALAETRALKVLISNLMTQPGETDGMSCVDHVKAVQAHVGPVVDVVLTNGAQPSPDLVRWYAERGSQPVAVDRRALIEGGVIPVEADLLRQGRRLRHDPGKVARCLIKLARCGL